jgi:hypothetical protein
MQVNVEYVIFVSFETSSCFHTELQHGAIYESTFSMAGGGFFLKGLMFQGAISGVHG